jgi:transcription elongation factor Elf1
MDEKVNQKNNFSCKICNKKYSSASSLCNHNKKFHNNIEIKKDHLVIIKDQKEINFLSCKYCNKIFTFKTNKYRHENTCKLKEQPDKNMQETIKELKQQVALLLKEKGRIHHKTLQKINNQLTNVNNNSNNNSNNNNNINNGTINNTYVKFGNMDYEKILNPKQIRNILNKKYGCLEESIKKIHFNEEFPEYNNVFITNMRDNLAYVFNGDKFISIHKNEMLNELIDQHTNEINISLDKNKNKVTQQTIEIIETLIDKLNDKENKFTDNYNNKTFDTYRAYKAEILKLLVYNNSNKKKLSLLNSIELHEKILSSDETDEDSTC